MSSPREALSVPLPLEPLEQYAHAFDDLLTSSSTPASSGSACARTSSAYSGRAIATRP